MLICEETMKKPVQNIMDIPRIQEEVRSKHQKFAKKYGREIEKVFADHKLCVDVVVAKIHRIAIVLKEEGVIDKIVINNVAPVAEMRLWKDGMISYLNIYTNGRQIMLKGYAYTTGLGSDLEATPKRYTGVDRIDFDWVNFASELVDYIHTTLYERKEVLETKISLMFEPKSE